MIKLWTAPGRYNTNVPIVGTVLHSLQTVNGKMQSRVTILLIFCYELAKMLHECPKQCLGSRSRGRLWIIPLKGGSLRDYLFFSKQPSQELTTVGRSKRLLMTFPRLGPSSSLPIGTPSLEECRPTFDSSSRPISLDTQTLSCFKVQALSADSMPNEMA
jgi:hypothetical protein